MPDITSDAIEHSVLVRAAPEEVYEALTTAAGLDGWFTEGSQADRRPGGLIWFRWRAMMNSATGWGEALTLMKFFVEHRIRYSHQGR